MFLKMGQRPDVGLIPGPSSPFPQQQEFVADGCSFQEFLDEEFSDAKQKRQKRGQRGLSVPQLGLESN